MNTGQPPRTGENARAVGHSLDRTEEQHLRVERTNQSPDTDPKESYLDRVVRLALTAGQRKIDLDKATAEIQRLCNLCVRNGIDPAPPDGA